VIAFDDRYTNSQVWVPQYMAIARKQTQGIAYHCYLSDPSAMQVESKLYPEMLQLETECSSKVSNVYPQQMMIRTLRDGAQGIQLWNAALDPQGGPKIASCSGNLPPFAGQPCIGAATVKPDGTYALTSDFWALAHFSKFIQLGAVRVDSTTPATCNTPVPGSICGVEDVVYKNPDGGRVMVVTANDGRAHKFNVQVGNQQFSFQIPDGGTLTFVWGP
jgi:glucosylceramidase